MRSEVSLACDPSLSQVAKYEFKNYVGVVNNVKTLADDDFGDEKEEYMRVLQPADERLALKIPMLLTEVWEDFEKSDISLPEVFWQRTF